MYGKWSNKTFRKNSTPMQITCQRKTSENCGRKLQEEAETVSLSTFRGRAWRRRTGEGKDCPVECSRLAGVIEELTLGLARNAASLFNSPCDFAMLQLHLDSQSIANFQEGNEVAVDPFFNLG
jgi:hypothetical protein